jgi:hypothetical protein
MLISFVYLIAGVQTSFAMDVELSGLTIMVVASEIK